MMFLVTFSMLFLVSAGYAMIQYESGRSNTEVKLSNNETKPTNTETSFKAKAPENNEPINVLLIGVDTDEGEAARTDTIMIAQYDAQNGDAKIASIMRDSYVEIPGYSNNKINASFFFGGPELLRQTIEKNFEMDIHYYAMVNFEGFVEVVDTVAPNGIEIDIKNRMYYRDGSGRTNIDLQPGLQTLDGEEALGYVRFRNDSHNDFGRVGRQQEVLNILKDELLTLSGVTRVPKLIGAVEPFIDTNLNTTRMLSIGRDFLLNPVDDIQTLRIPVENGYSDKSYSHAGAVLELDFEKNRDALQLFFSTKSGALASENKDNEDDKES